MHLPPFPTFFPKIIDKSTPKARKNLSFSGIRKPSSSFEFLKLSKPLIQTILKKDRFKKAPESFLSPMKLQQYGICGKTTFLCDSERLTLRNLLRGRYIQEIQLNSRTTVRDFRALRVLRHLRRLDIDITATQLLQVPKALANLTHLKQLVLKVMRDQPLSTEEITKTILELSQSLVSLKHLKTLSLELSENVLQTPEIGATLLAHLGELNLRNFSITLFTKTNVLADGNTIAKFLSKVESLSFPSGRRVLQGNHRKLFCLPEAQLTVENLSEILPKCSSLQRFYLNPTMTSFQIPLQGAPESLKSFDLFIQTENVSVLRDTLSQTCQFLENSKIEALTLEINCLVLAELGEEFSLLHQSLEKIQLKSYVLAINSNNVIIKTSPLRDFSTQIAKLQSLETLRLYVGRISNGMAFQPIFEGLPNLKSFRLSILGMIDWTANLPVRSISKMVGLEKLEIQVSPAFPVSGDALQNELTKLPLLKYVKLNRTETMM